MKSECIFEKSIQKIETEQKIKYQDIIYHKEDRYESISPLEERPVDFLLAMSEMEKLDYTFDKNRIGFSKRYGDAMLFFRQTKSMWDIEVPIFHGSKWSKRVWVTHSDSVSISNMVRSFFEDTQWLEMMNWRKEYHG